MHIAQIVKVRLKVSACDHLSYSAYTRVQEWLTQWTPVANFKAVIAEDRHLAIEACRIQMHKEEAWIRSDLIRLGVRSQHFYFNVSDQEVVNNQFWMSTGVVCGTDFSTGDMDDIKERT